MFFNAAAKAIASITNPSIKNIKGREGDTMTKFADDVRAYVIKKSKIGALNAAEAKALVQLPCCQCTGTVGNGREEDRRGGLRIIYQASHPDLYKVNY